MTATLQSSRTEATRTQAPSRIIIEGVSPQVDGGRFPIKRVEGETIVVGADVFAEGHDVIRAVLRHSSGDGPWVEVPMTPLGNDRWEAGFTVDRIGRYSYTVEAWIDRFSTWRDEVSKKSGAGQDIASELLEGAEIVRQAADRAEGHAVRWLSERAEAIAGGGDQADRTSLALDPQLADLMEQYPDRRGGNTVEPAFEVVVDPLYARFGAWYEMFPRSASLEPGRHGTFRDVEARLPYIAGMGFDILYLPPIHPVGRSFRKGPNNTLTPGPGDPGSPWAIGATEGGHKDIHPELGTIEDFDRLVESARGLGLKVALDIAFQCSPDHPYVREHPEWFRHRPDGTIKYAENPPKKYQDIYPLEFDGPDWKGLYEELRDVFLYWVDHGVTVFRVDNPHTKPFLFWDWCIAEVKRRCPEAIFLSEAFTRPKLMKRLAKGGFNQSYTYFTWRNDKQGLTEYLTELTTTNCREYMRPNFFANTPDILHEYLQTGGPAAFKSRLVLAATMTAAYGIYGPPFEQCVGTPVRPGSEEYLDSEKYQVRYWNLDAPGNLTGLITRVNQARREHPALQSDWNIRFHHVDNDRLIAYSKATPDRSDVVLVVVNLDPQNTQSGWTYLDLAELGISGGDAFSVHDLISGGRFHWQGASNFVMLDPHQMPAHIFHVSR
ncbi:alpha-1,4-glucan--maltose-1-phosphate maltosyltransferase [Tautonia plasticadhaerens]|uniref:Alpha-1,4-glucan:maltose-1-phosphate maltosyltransferase n=1 Tax=Tautonia plasticadhaerens TaxID=2527974 RepID=A0A518H7I1_9BACT|nr:alpha-1,4-glucan--maltose-1-phosphate maltosyltransferase [Tautonia plasticadhaerens]QDV36775.1 Alpha-1,4-glucan:maltose-1-phosphate maltosyltransferase 2 [Tautonia plasticadhaerens]